MKGKFLLAGGLALCLALCGCTVRGSDGGEGSGSADMGNNRPQDAYEVLIHELQTELDALRAEQVRKDAAYEARIEELEALLEQVSGGTGEIPSGSTASPERAFSYIEQNGGVVITAYLGNASTLEIPAQLGGKPVVAIGEGAFRNSTLEAVVLPSGVKSLGWFAFSGSYRLSSVTLPASVELIEYGAFDLCSSSLRFYCPSTCYAAQYAASYGIPVVHASN